MNWGSLRQAENRPSSKPDRVTRLRYTAGMIWSVSTLLRRSGVTMPVWVEKASMAMSPLEVGGRTQRAADGGGRRDCGRDEVGAAALARAAFEVAVRGGRAALPRCQGVGVHAQTHRASGFAPLRASVDEDLVEALVHRLDPDTRRARHDQHPNAVRDLVALDDRGGEPEVLDAPVRAGAEEDGVHLDLAHRSTGRQCHVLQGALGGGPVGRVVVV